MGRVIEDAEVPFSEPGDAVKKPRKPVLTPERAIEANGYEAKYAAFISEDEGKVCVAAIRAVDEEIALELRLARLKGEYEKAIDDRAAARARIDAAKPVYARLDAIKAAAKGGAA